MLDTSKGRAPIAATMVSIEATFIHPGQPRAVWRASPIRRSGHTAGSTGSGAGSRSAGGSGVGPGGRLAVLTCGPSLDTAVREVNDGVGQTLSMLIELWSKAGEPRALFARTRANLLVGCLRTYRRLSEPL